MFLSGDMQEKAEGVVAFIAAKIALKGLPASVVSHMDRVHNAVPEGDAAELAAELIGEAFLRLSDRRSVDGHQTRHGWTSGCGSLFL